MHFFCGLEGEAPSQSTVNRALTNAGLTGNVLTRSNIRKDPLLQLAYLDRISHVEAYRIIDIDGMVQSPKDFYDKYGLEFKGNPAIMNQIVLGMHPYTYEFLLSCNLKVKF